MSSFVEQVEQYLKSNSLPENVEQNIKIFYRIVQSDHLTIDDDCRDIFAESLVDIINSIEVIDVSFHKNICVDWWHSFAADNKTTIRIFEELNANWNRRNKNIVANKFGHIFLNRNFYCSYKDNIAEYLPIINFCQKELKNEHQNFCYPFSKGNISDDEYGVLELFFSENIKIEIYNLLSPCKNILKFIFDNDIYLDLVVLTANKLEDEEIELIVEKSDANSILRSIIFSLDEIDENYNGDEIFHADMKYITGIIKILIKKNILECEQVGLLLSHYLYYLGDENYKNKYICEIIDIINNSEYDISEVVNKIIGNNFVNGWRTKMLECGVDITNVIKLCDELDNGIDAIEKKLVGRLLFDNHRNDEDDDEEDDK